MTSFESRIAELGLIIPPPPSPAGAYTPVRLEKGIAFLSGQLSRTPDGRLLTGKAGNPLDLQEAKAAARAAALNVLSVIKHHVGFERMANLLRVVGYVQTHPDFFSIPDVVNGASELFLDVFGPQGVHARTAVGVSSLPSNAAVEIEVTLLLK